MNNIATFFRESRTGRFFILLGIICIVMSILLFRIVDHNKNYIKTDAIISKTELVQQEEYDSEGNKQEALYRVYVKYTVNEKEYEEELADLSDVKVGDKMEISYNPDNPTEISQPATILLPIIVLVVGAVSLIGGVFSIVKAVKKQKSMKEQEREWENGK